jgi:hypothetical protein
MPVLAADQDVAPKPMIIIFFYLANRLACDLPLGEISQVQPLDTKRSNAEMADGDRLLHFVRMTGARLQSA